VHVLATICIVAAARKMVDRRDEVSRGPQEDYRHAAAVVPEAVIAAGQPRSARLCGRRRRNSR
jgi:hypothetical protein